MSVLLGEAHSSGSQRLRVYWYCCKILAFWFGDLKRAFGALCMYFYDFKALGGGQMTCTILYCLRYKLRDNILILCHAKILFAVCNQPP